MMITLYEKPTAIVQKMQPQEVQYFGRNNCVILALAKTKKIVTETDMNLSPPNLGVKKVQYMRRVCAGCE